MARNIKYRLSGYILLSLMVISFVSSISLMGTDVVNREDENKNNTPLPLSQNAISTLKINGTELYEDGRYYFYKNETLNIVSTATTDVTNAWFIYNHSSTPSQNGRVTLSKSGNEFSSNVYFAGNKLTGEYNAYISSYNGSTYQNYSFYIILSDPEPVIHAIFLRDTAWNNVWVRIYEGQTVDTYRSTTLELRISVANRDDLNAINSVEVAFENGSQNVWGYNKLTSGTVTTFNGISVKNYTSTAIKTNFNASVTGREAWKPGEVFDVSVKANDTANNYWRFDFYVNILNRAPKITEFSVSPNNIPSPATSNTITVTVNASDLEDDVVYQSTLTDTVPYNVYSRSFGLSTTAAQWNQSEQPSQSALLFRAEGVEHKIKLDNTGCYYVNFTLNPIYAERIPTWTVSFRYWTNTTSDIWFQVYDYESSTWRTPEGSKLTGHTNLTYFDHVVNTLGGSGFYNISRYARATSGYVIQVRFRQASAVVDLGKLIYMDYINLTYNPLIRVSSPSVLLGVYDPLSSTGEWVDIKGFWNTYWAPGNKWSYRYTLNRSSALQGAYTFVVRVYDYGYTDYIDPEDLSSHYFYTSQQAFADASFLVNYGIPRGQLNNLTGSCIVVNETTNPAADKDVKIRLTVSDTFDGASTDLTYRYQMEQNEIYFQDGSSYLTSQVPYGLVPQSYIQSVGNSTANDLNITRITLNNSPQSISTNQSIIFTHYLNHYYWLNSENISGIKLLMNWHFDNPNTDLVVSQVGVDFYNWNTKKWSNTIWTATSGENELNPSPPQTKNLNMYTSTELTDKTFINQIVNGSNNNKLMVRIFLVSDFVSSQFFNVCIDYHALEVRYTNYFSALVHISDSDGNLLEYAMKNTVDQTTYRVWEYDFKIKSNSSKNYIMWFDVQNGNSSSKLIGGRFSSIKFGVTNYLSVPFVSFSEQKYWDANYTISVKQRVLSSTLVKGQTSIFRIENTFMTNGTLASTARIPESYYQSFKIQFRLGGQTAHQIWDAQSVLVDSTSIDYDQVTGFWNLSYVFPSSYKAGRYFYRLFLKNADGRYYATEWADMRMLNYQPKNFDIEQFTPTGSYYRENTLFNFDLHIDDVESQASGITIGFQMICEDRNGNPYVWYRDADSVLKVKEIGNTFRLTGGFRFGREINVGTYYNIYIVVTDDDPVWPQTAKLRFAANLLILNNAPVASQPIDSNRTADAVYRNNAVQLYWNITDLDDWHYENFTLNAFSVNYNNGSGVIGLSGSLINYDYTDHRFEFNRFYSIWDSNSTHTYTIDYTDPDGAHLTTAQTLNVLVKDNLPSLLELRFENVNKTEDGLLYYSSLVADNNLSDFQVYRGTDVVKVTIQLTDIEDSYRSDRNYNISRVYFRLIHNQVSEYDPWPNAYGTWDDLEMIQTGEFGGIETWELNFTLPTSSYFYAGGMQFQVIMKDADNGFGINSSGVFGVRNHVPYFALNAQNNFMGFVVLVNTTLNPTAVKYAAPIIIRVYAADDDVGQLGITGISVSFQIQTNTRITYGQSFFDSSDWIYNSTHYYYELLLHTDPTRNPEMSSTARTITLTVITIEDNDAGHIDNTVIYGDVTAQKSANYELSVYRVFDGTVNPFVIILPIAGVGVAVFLIWYYRKYFSYRKYMD